MTSFQTTLRGHVSQADKARSDYAYLPFILPEAARRLHVRYKYSARMTADKVHGGNVIDLGLFDPRGAAFPGGDGFRGWSGSARSEFTLAIDEATPGYLPGPLPAGRYLIVLGLYRIWPQGADYEVEIDADLEPIAQANQVNELPAPAFSPHVPEGEHGPRFWLRGDLQSHTFHSDAKGSPEQLVAKARALGLDFLAITDHNTVSHHAVLPTLAGDDLLLIPGQEVTTYYGHLNVWGTSRWCDFRCESAGELAKVIDLARKNGGVCSINHPKEGGPAWEYGSDVDVQAMEVWQGPWPHRNAESVALWDQLLCAGKQLPAVGGSDYHCPSGKDLSLLRLGQPTTWVEVTERSVGAILAAICAGRTTIGAHPNGARLYLCAEQEQRRAEMGGTLSVRSDQSIQVEVEVLGGAGHILQVVADGHVVHTCPVASDHLFVEVELFGKQYVRAELAGDMPSAELPPGAPGGIDLADWRWALSNPIYLKHFAGRE